MEKTLIMVDGQVVDHHQKLAQLQIQVRYLIVQAKRMIFMQIQPVLLVPIKLKDVLLPNVVQLQLARRPSAARASRNSPSWSTRGPAATPRAPAASGRRALQTKTVRHPGSRPSTRQ